MINNNKRKSFRIGDYTFVYPTELDLKRAYQTFTKFMEMYLVETTKSQQ